MDIRKQIEEVIESHLLGDYADGALQRFSEDMIVLFQKLAKDNF